MWEKCVLLAVPRIVPVWHDELFTHTAQVHPVADCKPSHAMAHVLCEALGNVKKMFMQTVGDF